MGRAGIEGEGSEEEASAGGFSFVGTFPPLLPRIQSNKKVTSSVEFLVIAVWSASIWGGEKRIRNNDMREGRQARIDIKSGSYHVLF